MSKRELKWSIEGQENFILQFIAASDTLYVPSLDGGVKKFELNKKRGVATFKEIRNFLRKVGVGIADRTIYERLKKLRDKGYIQFGKTSREYVLTLKGAEKSNLLNSYVNEMAKTRDSLFEGPIYTHIHFPPTLNGKTPYVDIFIRITEPKKIELIKKAMLQAGEGIKGRSDNTVYVGNLAAAELGNLISKYLLLVIELYCSGQYKFIFNSLQDEEKQKLLNKVTEILKIISGP